MGLADKADKTETALALWVRFWDFVKQFGVTNQITTAIWLAILTGWSWIVGVAQNVPLWAWLPTGLVFATYSLKLWSAIKVARSLRGVKKFNVQQFGADCLTYYSDYAAIMSTRNGPQYALGDNFRDAAFIQWQRNVEFSKQTSAIALERFGPRAYSLVQQMKSLGIPQPSMFHFSYDGGAVSLYIGVVGDLLSKGLLDEARTLDPKSTWGAGFR